MCVRHGAPAHQRLLEEHLPGDGKDRLSSRHASALQSPLPSLLVQFEAQIRPEKDPEDRQDDHRIAEPRPGRSLAQKKDEKTHREGDETAARTRSSNPYRNERKRNPGQQLRDKALRGPAVDQTERGDRTHAELGRQAVGPQAKGGQPLSCRVLPSGAATSTPRNARAARAVHPAASVRNVSVTIFGRRRRL